MSLGHTSLLQEDFTLNNASTVIDQMVVIGIYKLSADSFYYLQMFSASCCGVIQFVS
jgi:hypothetical protein